MAWYWQVTVAGRTVKLAAGNGKRWHALPLTDAEALQVARELILQVGFFSAHPML